MHWACKRGDENLVKLLAGVARQVVNERSVSIIICRYRVSDVGYLYVRVGLSYSRRRLFKP